MRAGFPGRTQPDPPQPLPPTPTSRPMLHILPLPITGPATEPATVAQVKFDARLDGTEWDDHIPGYIAAARQACEQQLGGLRLVAQTLRAEADSWADLSDPVPILPARSAVVSWWDGAAWSALSTTLWVMRAVPGGAQILPTTNATWPTLPDVAGPRVRVDITAGLVTDGADVPATLCQWIRLHAAAMVDQPAAATEKPMQPLPWLDGLLDPYRVWAR